MKCKCGAEIKFDWAFYVFDIDESGEESVDVGAVGLHYHYCPRCFTPIAAVTLPDDLIVGHRKGGGTALIGGDGKPRIKSFPAFAKADWAGVDGCHQH